MFWSMRHGISFLRGKELIPFSCFLFCKLKQDSWIINLMICWEKSLLHANLNGQDTQCDRPSGIYIIIGFSEKTWLAWFIPLWVFVLSCILPMKAERVAVLTSLLAWQLWTPLTYCSSERKLNDLHFFMRDWLPVHPVFCFCQW